MIQILPECTKHLLQSAYVYPKNEQKTEDENSDNDNLFAIERVDNRLDRLKKMVDRKSLLVNPFDCTHEEQDPKLIKMTVRDVLAIVRYWMDLRNGSIQLNCNEKPIEIKPIRVADATHIFGSLISKDRIYQNHMMLRLARLFGYDFASNLDTDYAHLRNFVNA